jgi:DNA gyrase subunit A
MPADTIRVAGRATQGVKLISIREGDSIAAVCVVSKEEETQPAPETEAADNTEIQE